MSGAIVVQMRSDGVQQPEACDVDDGGAGDGSGQRIDGRVVAADADAGQDFAIADQRAKLRAERLDRALDGDPDGGVLSFLGRHRVEVFGQLVN